jgi:ribosomal-protein-alanine N-acetyltransferase
VSGAPPELRTSRLLVRLARPGMEGALARFLRENFPGHLDRWSPPVGPAFFTQAFWAERLGLSLDEYHSGRSARFVMQELDGDARLDAPVIGTCNYTNIVRGPFQACFLGYQVGREHEGQGLMAEALRAGNGFVFGTLRLHRIMANYRPENERSARLLERLGFVREGLARDYLFIDGAWRDHVMTALTHPAYDARWVQPAG